MQFPQLLVLVLIITTQDVYPNSPASTAGLRSFSDYIIGTPDSMLTDKDELQDLVEMFSNEELRLFVYNADDDICREV